MRLHICLTRNQEPVPFSYQYPLAQRLHYWLGADNPWHDELSLYSLGSLRGGRREGDALNFPKGASWRISTFDADLAHQLVDALQAEPAVRWGMQIESVQLKDPPDFRRTFRSLPCDSPILLKQAQPGGYCQFITHESPELAEQLLTESLAHKLRAAALPELAGSDFRLRFDPNYRKPKTKLIQIKQIRNRAVQCPVEISGPPEVQQFAWLTGVGNSTGIGFGALR